VARGTLSGRQGRTSDGELVEQISALPLAAAFPDEGTGTFRPAARPLPSHVAASGGSARASLVRIVQAAWRSPPSAKNAEAERAVPMWHKGSKLGGHLSKADRRSAIHANFTPASKRTPIDRESSCLVGQINCELYKAVSRRFDVGTKARL
jgi:hypothetical protein